VSSWLTKECAIRSLCLTSRPMCGQCLTGSWSVWQKLAPIRRGDIHPQNAGDDWQIPRIIVPLQATEYVIKHTWGWGRKHAIRLSHSEIQHGRKGKGGRRLDAGTGLGNSTLTGSIELARALGLLTIEEDNDDQGRQKRYYLPRLKPVAEASQDAAIELHC